MGLFGWMFYILMGIVLFFLLMFLERRFKFSKRNKLLFSILFLMIVSGFCYRYAISFTSDIFLIFVFTFITDVIFTSYFLDNNFFDRNDNKIIYYFELILIGFILNQEFINRVNQVFLTGAELRLLLWAFMFVFLYHFLDDNKVISKNEDSKKYMSVDSVLGQYAKLKYQYFDECDCKDKDFSNLLYSIMIFQNHHRNKTLRKIDYFLFRFNGNKRPLGIMQVESKKYITDIESIELTKKTLEKICYKGSKKSISNDISTIIQKYSEENAEEIQYIFDIIKKF